MMTDHEKWQYVGELSAILSATDGLLYEWTDEHGAIQHVIQPKPGVQIVWRTKRRKRRKAAKVDA